MQNFWIEAIGWVAMAITITSFFFSEMKKLRTINFIGCLVWMLYGTLLVSAPIVLTNVAIGLTHTLWFLRKEKTSWKPGHLFLQFFFFQLAGSHKIHVFIFMNGITQRSGTTRTEKDFKSTRHCTVKNSSTTTIEILQLSGGTIYLQNNHITLF